jgi:hypothetical protein
MSPLPEKTRRPTVAYWPTEQEMRIMEALDGLETRRRREIPKPAGERKSLLSGLIAVIVASVPAMHGQPF